MAIIEEAFSEQHACPHRDFRPCAGQKCMGWLWADRGAETRETDNLVETPEGLRPVGNPKPPEGEGWEADGAPFDKGYHRSAKDGLPKASAQRWVRTLPHRRGQCGLNRGWQTEWGSSPW